MKIFLDDYRIPLDAAKYMHKRIGKLNPIYLEEWAIVENYAQFEMVVNSCIKNNIEITHVSFDHDLAEEHYAPKEFYDTDWHSKQTFKEKTGLECAKFLKDKYAEISKELPIMFVHSMNPVGTQNIINLFK